MLKLKLVSISSLLAIVVLLFALLNFQTTFAQSDPFGDFVKALTCLFFPSDPVCLPVDANKIIRDTYKQTPLTPPSNFYPPGTIVSIREDDPLGISLSLICTQEQVLGEDYEPPSSGTAELLHNKEFSASAEINAQIDKLIEIGVVANLEHLKKISVSLENATIFEMPSADAYTNIGNESFIEGCAKAVNQELLDGDNLTIIKSVIEADLAYKLDTGTELGTKAQLELTQAIAPIVVGGKVKAIAQNSITAEGLHLGIVSDPSLFNALAKEIIASLQGSETGFQEIATTPEEQPLASQLILPEEDISTAKIEALVVGTEPTIIVVPNN